jgi:CRISPR/Cas system CSM-associated protein Csm4 (group 5 of RAMP superfamily)
MPAGLLVRLRPLGPWRIGPATGARNRADTIYHSDTLYAAVTCAMRDLGFLEPWLHDTAEAPSSAVRFTSCYPFQRKTLFVVPPKNLWPPPPSARLRYRGAKFVALPFVEAMLGDQPIDESRWLVDGASECLMPSDRNEGPFRTTIRTGVAVDRLNPAAVEPHHLAGIEFATGCGLWFMATFADDDARRRWVDPVCAALTLLADTGFGGKRSSGWGACEAPEFFDGDLKGMVPSARWDDAVEGERAWWLLSLFTPSEQDAVDWRRGNYGAVTRAGRMATGQLKHSGTMVEEGSVLVCPEEPRGNARNVAPEGAAHAVYRAGFAVAIPIQLRSAQVTA